jgi:hypothetical protein
MAKLMKLNEKPVRKIKPVVYQEEPDDFNLFSQTPTDIYTEKINYY